jgi:sugar phosphate isomerase/epimerase
MKLGYNTNGFAHHRIEDALSIIAEIGYECVALTIDHDTLDPPDRSGVSRCVARLRPIIQRTGLSVTIETGARFILDPRRKHWPAMISVDPSDRCRRIEYLKAAIDLAAELGADCVSLWSGAPEPRALARANAPVKGVAPNATAPPHRAPASRDHRVLDDDARCTVLLDRLCDSLHAVLDHAAPRNVRLAFEPEPGMFIDTMARFTQLVDRIDHPLLGLTLDVGHLHCQGDGDIRDHLARHGDKLFNIHIEDMCRGVHEHLMFGEGEIEFPDVLTALQAAAYTGPVHVELSRHSASAVDTARAAYQFLKQTATKGDG